MALVFVTDLITPLGYIAWIFYILPILIVFKTENPGYIYLSLFISGTLIIIGLFLSPSGIPLRVAALNRILGITSISIFACVVVRLMQFQVRLKNESELLQKIIDTVPVMFTIYDPQINHLIINKEVERATGWTADDNEREGILNLTYPDPEYRKSIENYMKSLNPGFKDMNVCTKDGRLIETMWANIMIPDGRQVGIGIDISKRKRMEEALKHRTQDLAEVNKELESFTYSVSHDLRSPIRSIKGFAEILIEAYGDKLDETAINYLQRIISGADRVNSLIEDMLQLSKVSRQDLILHSVDLSAIALSIASDLKKSNPDRDVEFEVKRDLRVYADERLIKIALSNLLGNAWKYTAKKEHAVIEFSCHDSKGEKIFFIRDNGAGFNMKFAQKLFEPFKRFHLESEFPGTGIGLAIVDRVIRKHGGKIWAEGSPGNGATFYFVLPEKQ